ncbi:MULTISPECIES: hypothetical protein [unclassified Bradyrhizobium]|uniref:hypothetical protein n=1 Tax=unclassified Bradyrhizobium TaxID=2631580 RepID=UPI0028E85939|nr:MULTISPECIES: hypothetical protein [unclassified Bradyrhizobium]
MSTIELASGYLTRKELAEQLGNRLRGKPYTEYAIRVWERQGTAPPRVKIGAKTMYRIESVETWLRAKEGKAR